MMVYILSLSLCCIGRERFDLSTSTIVVYDLRKCQTDPDHIVPEVVKCQDTSRYQAIVHCQ